MASSIGIKMANGEFFPILPEHEKAKKRLVLTTAHDRQQSAQIDLYLSAAASMADAQYIGTVLVEELKSRKQGEPSVELIVSSDGNGIVSAEARDLENPVESEKSHLAVSLGALKERSADIGVPEFDLEVFDAMVAENIFADSSKSTGFKLKKSLPALIVGFLLIVLAAGGLWFFVFDGKASFVGPQSTAATRTAVETVPAPAAPPERDSPPPSVPPIVETPLSNKTSAPVPAAAPQPPKAQPPAVPPKRKKPVAPVLSYTVPATIPRGGVLYKVRWGDTLWDIALAFYDNPRLYRYLARYNGISNPNKILPGRTIRVPPL
ncbi:MAG: LysM peptidoglycan-binding domain-containing protein [Spirochaetaceae bacterium]|nr:LysM peptidoglycan-binding domain-containing protein [Spirochaetaceae bacterium]